MSEAPPPEEGTRASTPPTSVARRTRSPFVWVVLVAFAGMTFYLSGRAPKEQHLRFVLGAAAPRVTRLACDYEGPDGTSRTTELTWDHGDAPRVVALDPDLVPGEYTLHLRVFSKDGQNTVERRVTLSSGTASVDLVDAVPAAPSAHP